MKPINKLMHDLADDEAQIRSVGQIIRAEEDGNKVVCLQLNLEDGRALHITASGDELILEVIT